jgi:acetyl-CoA acyltransferase
MSYELAAYAIRGVLARSDIDPKLLGMVMAGTVVHEVETSNVAREAMLAAGIASTVPACTTSMAGLSATASVTSLCDMISLGRINAGIAVGTETFSDIPLRYSPTLRRGAMQLRQDSSPASVMRLISQLRPRDLLPVMPSGGDFTTGMSMGECTEVMIKHWGVTRAASDAFTVRSHALTLQAIVAGHLQPDIDAIEVGGSLVRADNSPRANCSLELLAKLKPVFDKATGIITAGTASRFTDGAAAVLLSTEAFAAEHDLTPLACVRDYVFAGVRDIASEMLLGPAASIPRLLAKHQLSIADIGVWELHEAFAAQILANQAALDSPEFAQHNHDGWVAGQIPLERLNAWGGSLALGNPFAATGTRLLMTAARRLHAENARFAVVSSCAGGGLGTAVLLERA